MSKRSSRHSKKGCAAIFGLPFLSLESNLPGLPGEVDDEIALERQLISIAKRGIAPNIIAVIEEADAASVEGPLDKDMISLVNDAVVVVGGLNAPEEDRVILIAKLQSFLE